MLKQLKTIFLTATKLAFLLFLLVCLYVITFQYLPKEQQNAIHNFCRDFGKSKFNSTAGKVYVGKACDFDSQVIASTCQNAVILDGPIGKEMYEDLKSSIELEQLPHRLICLRSRGGATMGAKAISDLIRTHQLDTCLSDYVEYDKVYASTTKNFTAIAKQTHSNIMCDSACPFILIAGKNRIGLGNSFKLKLHRSASPTYLCVTTIYKNSDLAKGDPILDIVNKSPVHELEQHQMLYQRSLQTDFKKLDEVSHDDFDKYGIFTIQH